MAVRPRGRPKVFDGPLVTVKLPALTHNQVNALAKIRGQSRSQVVRDALAEAMRREWGPGQ